MGTRNYSDEFKRYALHQTTFRGSQYCSHDYQKLLRQHGFQVSMSGKGQLL